MSSLALALVLCAALLHAAWNLGAKKAGADHHFLFSSAIMAALLWLPIVLFMADESGKPLETIVGLRRTQRLDWIEVMRKSDLKLNVLFDGVDIQAIRLPPGPFDPFGQTGERHESAPKTRSSASAARSHSSIVGTIAIRT